MTQPYSRPMCDCGTDRSCPRFQRLQDAWHTRRRLEMLADRAADNWRKEVDAYNEHLREIAKEAA